MAATQQIQSWKAYVSTHLWKCPKDGKLYELDSEKMKKDEYAFRATRMPGSILEPGDMLLHNADWQDDGESYIICNSKYTQEVRK